MFDTRHAHDEIPISMSPDPEIDRPICLFGVGRTGTTIVMHLLAQHRALGWFSSFHQKMPRLPILALYSRIVDLPWIRPRLPSEWSLLPKASEGARVVRHLTAETSPEQQQHDGGASPQVIMKYRNYVKSILRYQGKSRFLQKHTGLPRIAFFSAIFPDARFVHIARDGRAVAHSFTKAHWWEGTMSSWRWGEMDAAGMREYLAADMEPVVLAAIVWKTIMRCIENERALLSPDRYLEVRYDRFVSEPLETMRRICEFCDLPFDERFQKRVAAIKLNDSDVKWRKELTPRQIQLLEGVLDTALQEYAFRG